MVNQFIINTKEVNYSLANPPKGWSIQNNINTDKYVCVYRDWETDRKSTRLNSSH